MFPFEQDNHNYSPMCFESEDEWNLAQQYELCGAQNWGVIGNTNDFISSPLFQDLRSTDDMRESDVQKLTWIQSEISKLVDHLQMENKFEGDDISEFPVESFRILKNFVTTFGRLNGKYKNLLTCDTSLCKLSARNLSTIDIVRLAGENFIRSFSQGINELSDFSHPFLGLSDEKTRDVELIQDLLVSAEKVGQQKFDCASKLLDHCAQVSSSKETTIQRLIYIFCQALKEKVDRETGKLSKKGFGKEQLFDLEISMTTPSPALLALHRLVPFWQVSQFAGLQAIIENVSVAKRVHIVDLDIGIGTHCSVLIQALANRSECPVEHLKITAIGTKSRPIIDRTGARLRDFAESMSLPFSFDVIMVADMIDLTVDLFDLDNEEAVAVYSPSFLWTMIAKPDQLDCLMRVIRNISPCIMVVNEVEANLNSPKFVNRFIEALFFNAALFDSLEDCMDHDERNKAIVESCLFGQGIRNIVAAEGEERTIRHVNMNVWRAFFARSGMKDVELSTSSLYQASLMVNIFDCGSSCSLENDGNSLIIGWKGTPILSLSAWKFE